jgi:hypothetical protein
LQTSSLGVIDAKHLGDNNIPFRASRKLAQNVGVQATNRILDARFRRHGAESLCGGMPMCAGTNSSLLVLATITV